MKKLTIQIKSALQPKKILLILLSFGFIGLHAQDSIVPVGSTVKKLSSDQFLFLEGPVWYNDSVLLFVDDGLAGTSADIYQYDPVAEQFSTWPTNATHCVGLSCDKDGNLIGASLNILMMNKAGQVIKTLASVYNGKPFDNPNDLIADNKGGVYFTDPDFFITVPPQDKTAVYYINPNGNVTRVIDDLAEPNGLVLSPDGKKLYVVDSGNKYVYSWDVANDGSVSDKLSLAELQTAGGDTSADGMAIDIKGNIYVATAMGIQVFSPQGAALTTIVLPEHPTNCDFGGKDFKTLYITAHENDFSYSNLYSIDLNYPGYAVSRKGFPFAIQSFPDKPMVEIYPNPVSDFLYVQLKTGNVNSLEILNMDGKKESIRLNNEKESGFDINTEKLKSGIYLLKIVYKDGTVTKKFVKE